DVDVGVAVAVAVERQPIAVGRPCVWEIVDEIVGGEQSFAASVCVDDDDLEVDAIISAERKPLPVGRPNGVEFREGIVRKLRHAGSVGVHGVDIEIAAAAAVERYRSLDDPSREEAELRSACGRGDGALGAVTACAKGPNYEVESEAE